MLKLIWKILSRIHCVENLQYILVYLELMNPVAGNPETVRDHHRDAGQVLGPNLGPVYH